MTLKSLPPIVLLLVLASTVRAQYDYRILYDKRFTQPSGAADLVTAQKLIFTAEDFILKPTLFDEHDFLTKTGGIAYRLAKSVLLDIPTDVFIGVLNHEVLGHGARLREYGSTKTSYDIQFFPPYGNGSGVTHPGNDIGYSDDEDIAMRIAGSQANATISEELRDVFLETGTIHYRQAFAYIGGILDLTSYVLETNGPGYGTNDVAYYLAAQRDRGSRIDVHTLKANVLFNFANPFLLYSLNGYFNHYLIGGRAEVSYPMIHVFGLWYLPSMRLGLTPFGAEIRLENLVRTPNKIWDVYVGYDGFGGYNSSRVGISAEHLYRSDLLDIGAQAEAWDQPFLTLSGHNPKISYTGDVWRDRWLVGGMGGMLLANATVHPLGANWGVRVEAGVKSAGFTEKEHLDNGPIFRGGLTVRM